MVIGNPVTLGGGGGGIQQRTRAEWNALTPAERIALGRTLISDSNSFFPEVYDLSGPRSWAYGENADTVEISVDSSTGTVFRGFYSDTSGDRIYQYSGENRGITRTSAEKVFICNHLLSSGYGGFLMFALSEAALSGTRYGADQDYNTLRIRRDNIFGMYVGAIFSGAFPDNKDVRLYHSGKTKNLKDLFSTMTAWYTMYNVNVTSLLSIPACYAGLLKGIWTFLNA